MELCEQEATPKQEDFLAYVLEQEIQKREQNRRARQLSRACFPVLEKLLKDTSTVQSDFRLL